MPNTKSHEVDEESPAKRRWAQGETEFLIAIAVFVATVAFQAGINPPGGVWQNDGDLAGKSILATKHRTLYLVFIVGTTLCLAFSLVQLLTLLLNFQDNGVSESKSRSFMLYAVGLAQSGLIAAYYSAVTSLTPKDVQSEVVAAMVAFLVGGVLGTLLIFCLRKMKILS